MKQRILVLGSEHPIAAKVLAALAASDWATPVPFLGTPGTLSAETLADVDAVFNGTAGRPAAIIANAQALYGALGAAGAALRVVHLSSMTVYGSLRGEARESTVLRSDIGAYGAAQVVGESLASKCPRSVILRPGCEYGPDCPEWSIRIARLLCAHRLGDLGTAGDGVCNLLFVDDLVSAVVASLRLPDIDGHAFNLAMRAPPTWNEYFVRFARLLGAVPVSRIKRRRLKIEATLLAPPLKALELVERRIQARSHRVPPPITSSLLNLCRQDVTLNVDKAEQVMSMTWMPLQDGLREAAAAYRRS